MSEADIEFRVLAPNQLTMGQHREVNNLRRTYYGEVFNQVGIGWDVDMDQFLNKTGGESWIDPNKASGESYRANPKVTVALANDALLGYMYTADDVSSRLSGLPGRVEKWAKLNMSTESLLAKRWFWIRELVAPYDERGIPQGLGAVATVGVGGRIDEVRPASCYPWQGEDELWDLLDKCGFILRGGESRMINPVPGEREAIRQFRATAESLAGVHNRLMNDRELPETARETVEDLKVLR